MISVTIENCPGVLHEADGDIGIVMCSAHGFEELCARKDWRILAQGIADLGLPVLRFDYHGTGDAPGDDDDAARVEAWLASLRAAIGFMREQIGARRVALLGLRLGAALAEIIAREDAQIAAFVALHPVVSGKAYARELGVMSKVIAHVEGAPAPVDGIEVAGFGVTTQTLAALREIDMLNSPRAPAPEIFVCAPRESLAAEKLAARWREMNARVDCADFPNYPEWISDPTTSRPPREAIASITQWIAQTIVPLAGKRMISAQSRAATPILDADYVEEHVWFGARKHLFGVLCRPANAPAGGAAVVMTNAGRNYHIGWARASVRMARALASSGRASLRIDVAGIGDSPDVAGRDPQVMYCDEPIEDLSAALDFLAARGMTDICVAGLCSGAHLAFHTALNDARISRLVMANLQRFYWRKGDSLEIAISQSFRSTDHYKRNLYRLETWKRMLRGEVKVFAIGRALTSRVLQKTFSRMSALTRPGEDDSAKAREGLRALSQRGARILLVYADSDGGLDELARHVGAGEKGLLKYPGAKRALLEGADHNLTPRHARQRLNELVLEFLDREATPAS